MKSIHVYWHSKLTNDLRCFKTIRRLCDNIKYFLLRFLLENIELVNEVLVFIPCAIVLRSGGHGEYSILIDKRQLVKQSFHLLYIDMGGIRREVIGFVVFRTRGLVMYEAAWQCSCTPS